MAAGAAASSLFVRPHTARAASKPTKPVVATDRSGKVVTAASWLSTHDTTTPDLVLGLDGEPYFLLLAKTKAAAAPSVDDDESVESQPAFELLDYALRAECTHLGCLVQPEPMGGGFACPCHGSKYMADGSVTRGPAPKALALARVVIAEGDGTVSLMPWSDADPRAAA